MIFRSGKASSDSAGAGTIPSSGIASDSDYLGKPGFLFLAYYTILDPNMQDMMKSPCQREPTRGRVMAYSAMVGYAVRLVLFSLAAGDDDRGSAEDEHDASDVEDRGADAAMEGI